MLTEAWEPVVCGAALVCLTFDLAGDFLLPTVDGRWVPVVAPPCLHPALTPIPRSCALRMTQLLPLWRLLLRTESPVACCHLGQGTGPKPLIGWAHRGGQCEGRSGASEPGFLQGAGFDQLRREGRAKPRAGWEGVLEVTVCSAHWLQRSRTPIGEGFR